MGDVARKIYDPDGTGIFLDIKTLGLKGLIDTTQKALDERKVIFEAGFQADGTLALADILIPVDDIFGTSWRMVEVKSSTAVKEYHVKDLAIQTAIASKAGIRLSEVSVAHVDRTWTYLGDQQYGGLLKEVDQTAQVRALDAEVAQWLSDAHLIANLPTPPAQSTGGHCSTPFTCGFIEHCAASEPKVEHPLAWLPRIQTKALKAHISSHGINAMEDVPDSILNELQLRVKKQTVANTVYFDSEGAKAALDHHPLPAYFLDFETISFAVPIWAGTRPYEQIPFQFSMHYLQAEDRELQHSEFLDLTGQDPTRRFAEALAQSCGQSGPIFVYNKGFEGARIAELIHRLKEEVALTASLASIKARLVDLKPITQNAYYNPEQEGSWSIKSVLAAMLPNLSYKNLEMVQDGAGAQKAYLAAIGHADGENGTLDLEVIQKQLLAYCELDTFAMVAIRSTLLEKRTSFL